jgi:hypothetical protein
MRAKGATERTSFGDVDESFRQIVVAVILSSPEDRLRRNVFEFDLEVREEILDFGKRKRFIASRSNRRTGKACGDFSRVRIDNAAHDNHFFMELGIEILHALVGALLEERPAIAGHAQNLVGFGGRFNDNAVIGFNPLLHPCEIQFLRGAHVVVSNEELHPCPLSEKKSRDTALLQTEAIVIEGQRFFASVS